MLFGVSLALGGCGDTSQNFNKRGKIDGYDASAFVDAVGRHFNMEAGKRIEDGHIHAVDWGNDGRFDEIRIWDLPKGHLRIICFS